MFGLGKKKNISVEYVEAGKRSPMSTDKVPVGDLPDVFEIDAPMEYAGKKWTIVAAVPDTKEEFSKTGKLQVFLAKLVELVPPADILFSLPTINDEIGLVQAGELTENEFLVHEDDWRQVEFIARSHAETVQRELREIRKIVETQSEGGNGFKRLYVRKTLPQPLAGAGLNTAAIKETFGILHHYDGLVISGYNGRVENGFALDVGGSGVLWGETDGKGNLLCLNLATSEGPGIPIKALPPDVADFCAKHKLLLVSWTAMNVLPR